jgi:IMP dehydrogenase/GMP reductase
MGDYDSIYLMPKHISTIRSRSDVNLNSDFHSLFPIFSSPMSGISGQRLTIEMFKNNCLGILHRFKSNSERINDVDTVFKSDALFGCAIGVNDFDNELKIADYALDHGCILLCLDLANAYLPQIQECGKLLHARYGNKISLMTGNIINKIGAQYVKNSGFDFVRCSIGSGNVCTTRSQTGVGRNALKVLQDCSDVDINLVIDGGIRTPGDVVKSFVCNADFAILGSVLAMANEAENSDGLVYGMASRILHEKTNKTIKSIEGRDMQIDITQKKPLKEILDQFLWGIKSACTYLDCKTYKDLPYNSEIIPVNEKF